MQNFSERFLLPSELYVIRKYEQGRFLNHLQSRGLSGEEDFLIREGRLTIVFTVELRREGETVYIFKEWEQSEVYLDAMAAGLAWNPGEVICYHLSESSQEDYAVGGVE